MTMMNSIRQNSLPRIDNGERYSSETMLSPIPSETTDSLADSFSTSNDSDLDYSSQKPSSQMRKLKKVFSARAVEEGSTNSVSKSVQSISSSFRGEEVFRIAINEDSLYEDRIKSPRWQRTVGAVIKPPSVQKLEGALGESDSESESDGYSSRRSNIRSLVGDDMNLDDSTHPIDSLQPPSISSLSTFGNKSTKSFGTATTMQMSDSSFRSGKRRGSLLSHTGSIYSHGSNRSSKALPKPGSSRGSLGLHSSSQFKEESHTSRTSHIRDDVEQSMDDSTHELPSPGPTHLNLRDYHPTIDEVSNSSRSSSQIRAEINATLDEDSSSQESSNQGSRRAQRTAISRKGRKSRSPRPPVDAREHSLRNRPRTLSGNPKSPSILRSSKSPHKNRNAAIDDVLEQIGQPDFDDEISSPSMRGERKILEPPPPSPSNEKSERGQRFTVRRTVSSPVAPTTRKQLLPNQGERSERLRRSVTDGTIDNDRSRSPSGRRRSSLVLKSSITEEVSARKGVSPVRGKLVTQSERGIRSIFKSPSNKATQQAMARSSSPGIRFRQMPPDKRKSHSTRAERSIPVDMEPLGDDLDVSLKNERGTFYNKHVLSFETDSGDESLKAEEDSIQRTHLRPFRGALPRSSSEGTDLRSSRESRRGVDRTRSTGMRVDMTGTSTPTGSPGIRFSRSLRPVRTTPVDKRKSNSTRAERTIPIDMDSMPFSLSEELHRPNKVSADSAVGEVDSNEKTTLGMKVMNKMKSLRRPNLSLRGNRTIDIEDEEEESKPEGNKVVETVKNFRRRSLSLRKSRSVEMDIEEEEEPRPETNKVIDKMSSLRRRSLSTRGSRSIEMKVEEETTKTETSKVMAKMNSLRHRSLSSRGTRLIDTELDEEEPKPQSKSMRVGRSVDVEVDEEPKLKNKSSRGKRSIDVGLDNGESKPKNKSSRGRRSISVDFEKDEETGKKSKSSRRERRSIDTELNEGKGKKSKSSRRGRRSIDVEPDEGADKKSKSSRRERRTMSIDMGLGSDNRKQKTKLSGRRTLSVDSGDSYDLESKQPKGTRSLVTESQEDPAKSPTRPRARSRKKNSPKKASKSPKKKSTKGNHSDDEGNETSYSTSLDAGSVSIDGPGVTKSRPSSPSNFLKKLKGLRSERSPRKDAGRSHSPKRSLKPSKSSTTRKTRLSIS